VLQNLGDAEEPRFVILDDAGVGGDANLAIGESIECLQHLIGVDPGREVDMNLDVLGGAIFKSRDAYFSLLVGFED
jgi:hypothetical protein